jgi:hypothetical protein
MWEVIETKCLPNKWKIVRKGYIEEHTSDFYPTKELAQKEADKRNNCEARGLITK